MCLFDFCVNVPVICNVRINEATAIIKVLARLRGLVLGIFDQKITICNGWFSLQYVKCTICLISFEDKNVSKALNAALNATSVCEKQKRLTLRTIRKHVSLFYILSCFSEYRIIFWRGFQCLHAFRDKHIVVSYVFSKT